MSNPELGSSGSRQQPDETEERRLAGWQRVLRWVLWLSFLGVAVANSQTVRFSGVEWLFLLAAVAFSIWCMARPLGGPKVELTSPTHVLGTFTSRTNWALVLVGALLTIAGVAGLASAVYDVATGRSTIGGVGRDVAIFVEGWATELVSGGGYDAELENTRAYALFLLLLPGLVLLWRSLIPLVSHGTEFRVEVDGSVMTRRRDGWEPLLEYQYSEVVVDGTAIRFTPPPDGPPAVVLPQARVFCRENGARLTSEVSAEFFRALLTRRGFEVSAGSHFTARRT